MTVHQGDVRRLGQARPKDGLFNGAQGWKMQVGAIASSSSSSIHANVVDDSSGNEKNSEDYRSNVTVNVGRSGAVAWKRNDEAGASAFGTRANQI